MSETEVINQCIKNLEAPASSQAGEKQPPQPSLDPLFIAYYLLMEATNVSSQAAIIHSKVLNRNALAQERLNNQAAQLQWYHLPKIVEHKHHKTIKHTHWTGSFWSHSGFEYTTYQKINWTTSPNATAVQEAQTKNQEVAAKRQILSEKLSVLQQLAQVGESGVDTITDEAMQTMQASSYILQVLETLTFKALLRQPPQ